jgi:hypothetical protein
VDAALAAELPLDALRLAREAGAAFPASLGCRVLLGRALAAQPDELEAAVAVLVAVLERDERSEEAGEWVCGSVGAYWREVWGACS